MKQEFNIEIFTLIRENDIIVFIEKYGIAIPITIPQDKFKIFLLTQSKLEFQLIYSEEPGPNDGNMTMQEYWRTGRKKAGLELIHKDLYEYIVSHSITYEGVVFSNSLTSIKLAFDLHKAFRKN